MKEFDNKILTEGDLIDIIRRAPKEICADAYQHFMEDLANLVVTHFGGEVDYVKGHITIIRHRCDNCQKTYEDDDPELIPLELIENLFMRIDVGGVVPSGECPACGALTYAKKEIYNEWIASIAHNECVPEDGWVYSKYGTEVDWNSEEEEASS